MVEDESRYDITLRPSAADALEKLEPDEHDRLRSTLLGVASHRSPTDHSKCELLKNKSDVYRVRVGSLRALVTLEKPELRVHRVGEREDFYERADADPESPHK